jgi:hypothetical protein
MKEVENLERLSLASQWIKSFEGSSEFRTMRLLY